MLTQHNTQAPPFTPVFAAEITMSELLEALGSNQGKTLRFAYDGREVKPGYHVTEIKAGRFEALDCGANPEAWSETFIQLWDIPEDGRSFMPVGKFLAIMRKVGQHVPFDAAAKLTFEVSDGVEAMQLFKATAIDAEADTVRVTLLRRPSSCKPRDRWLETKEAAPPASGSPAGPARPCCG
jgi:hypothetical protein